MKKQLSNQTSHSQSDFNELSFDFLIQRSVEKALMNVTEPLLESIVEKVLSRKLEESKDEPLDIEQAAKLIHKKKQTVYSYCSKGEIPFHKSGGNNIFFRSELVEWLKNN